ncbi:LLM class flavin-dependent oxidoreductase [Pseudorhodoferax soli]|uniref:Alkanesulfonate monooxygenase SsuD/methylene tetrahydromethanopterin reductase-like flavin-dependent oxidoreductase (Luciferase family) n=1 Tax=Pseudorhodoferax soli TaxID=545864 RepID=A0A368X530_9BURK|nr:LLM class flavin-dependent oxidoreductase [Pseudorhodoferax soli]RCW63122.1 alkanesulfonate monooxygenase SsuD/methylene tetrahydromethanopterin reductase-like flavin-dependent oxidoreductase (luciferase family) [Pseudorhodoferax soli]
MRIDLAGWTREATCGDHRAFALLFERAEQLGFDGVWFNEFRLPETPWPYPSPLLLAAALLARTERLRVGTSVLVLPLHHPLVLAEEIAQVDFQSAGRLDVGIGRGTEPAALQALQIAPESTRARFEQSCRLLRQALRGEALPAEQGAWRFPARAAMAPAVQRPHPPFYVAGSTPETLGFALDQDLPLLLSLEPPEGPQLAQLQAVATAQGRDAAALQQRSSLARYVCIGRDDAAVAQQLAALWPQLHQRRIHFAGRRGVPPAQVPPIDAARVLREQFIHGTPEACHAQIAALRARTGIGHLRCVFNANGLWRNAQALDAMALFAREVLPALRAL